MEKGLFLCVLQVQDGRKPVSKSGFCGGKGHSYILLFTDQVAAVRLTFALHVENVYFDIATRQPSLVQTSCSDLSFGLFALVQSMFSVLFCVHKHCSVFVSNILSPVTSLPSSLGSVYVNWQFCCTPSINPSLPLSTPHILLHE